MAIRPGLSAVVDHQVGDGDTALAVGSGDVPVLGTPCVVALVEKAAVAAIATEIPEGHTSVGARVELDHLVASPVGRRLRAEATLMEVDGRKLTFTVTVYDGDRVAAAGRVRRSVVERAAFLERAGVPAQSPVVDRG